MSVTIAVGFGLPLDSYYFAYFTFFLLWNSIQ